MSLFLHINFEFVAGRLLKVMAVNRRTMTLKYLVTLSQLCHYKNFRKLEKYFVKFLAVENNKSNIHARQLP